MAKPLRSIGKILTIAAAVAMIVFPPAAPWLALAATAANVGSQMLAKPPPARGSVSQTSFDPGAATPYVMGEGLAGGVTRYRVGYGGTIDKVVNPYLFEVQVFSGGGPVESISPRVDFATVPAWYSGYLYTDTQLGACPESSALTGHWGAVPGWSSSHKLSGQAAIAWSCLFDKNGSKFASGLPQMSAYGQWAKIYDPRLDSTRPGGSGSHRIDDETTYEWSQNPALHAAQYAYGRYQNGKLVMGIGMPDDAIDWDVVAAWANTCETNGWTIFGRVFEPGDKWANLNDICAAGGGQPIPMGVLSFRYPVASVALATIGEADLADPDASVCAMQSYRDRINEVIPKYTDPDSNWQQVQAEAVRVDDYVTEDGEVKTVEWPFNLVKDVDQASQLAMYRLVDSRELFPIQLTVKPQWRGYRPGDCLHVDLPGLGLDHDVIILNRQFDPATMTVKLTLISETAGKHAFALGQTGTAPPTPALAQTSQERDETAAFLTGTSLVGVGILQHNAGHDFDNGGSAPVGGNISSSVSIGDVPAGGSWRISFVHAEPLGGGSTGVGHYQLIVTITDGTNTDTRIGRVDVNFDGTVRADTLNSALVIPNTLSGASTITVSYNYSRTGGGADVDLAMDDIAASVEYIEA